ncbi:hypothetical protein RvY_00587 [Ramazzottius varieornatus]|uniref:Uncharacterized protein n=1 Tax=Ramazzottius varieornatus TaxID=947166 RepID=A0A1D1UDB1_RAMVA|nr:hypothetical protein RvY_00587 [Ramazzottius varieornatus]
MDKLKTCTRFGRYDYWMMAVMGMLVVVFVKDVKLLLWNISDQKRDSNKEVGDIDAEDAQTFDICDDISTTRFADT